MARAPLGFVVAVAACMAAACDRRPARGPIDQRAADALFEQIPVDVPPGMSDLTIDDRGVLWAVAERASTVVELRPGEPPVSHRLDGVDRGVDTEAIAWLGPGRFALGLEGGDEASAGIAFAELRGAELVVTATRALGPDELGVPITVNHGVEALCGRDGELLAAAESVGVAGGRRYAPLLRLRGERRSSARLWLTSATGKISALHCVIADDGTAQVLAIERHFGVARILRFTLRPGDAEVSPAIVYDLDPILRGALNLEGITRLPDGRIVAINDNQTRTVSGPTTLLVFRAALAW